MVRFTDDLVKLCYDLLKIAVSLLIIGPLVTQKALQLGYFIEGMFFSVAFLCLAIYLRSRE